MKNNANILFVRTPLNKQIEINKKINVLLNKCINMFSLPPEKHEIL